MMFKWIKDPFILGTDGTDSPLVCLSSARPYLRSLFQVVGEVVEVGSSVTRFKVGDRVVSQACGINEAFNDSVKGDFRLYTVLVNHMTAPIPPTIAVEQAAILPLAVITAASGSSLKTNWLFNYLPYPT